VTEFILSGLPDQPGFHIPLFFLFLGFYLITILGNLGLIILIALNSHLNTPMYLFLFNLFIIDLSCSSIITPRRLMSFISKKNIIYWVSFFPASLSFLTLLCLSFTVEFSGAVTQTGIIMSLTFFSANLINHFMCDILPFIELTCNSMYENELVVLVVVAIGTRIPSSTIFILYALILASFLHIHPTECGSKAFSTCSSHVIVVSLFYGSEAFMYLKPLFILPLGQGKVSSLFYTIVVPMLNPLMYSLRNKDVKIAFKNILSRYIFS
uniref:G-protein coupled receptors family 1 profile domain-containing protein n=1 Tax=Cavia porcellus TaxID=10141 RepID=A0A286X8Y3_CAVPO